MKIKMLLLIAAILVFVPTSSYAIVDFGLYGGYSFAGNINTGDAATNKTEYKRDLTGWEYGFIGHFNGGIPALVSFGAGGFYQQTNTKYEINSDNYNAKKKMYGFDIYAMLELPIIVHPYIRMGIAIKEKLNVQIPTNTALGTAESTVQEKYFKSSYYGIGVAISVAPMVRLFGEYVYNYSQQENNVVIQTNAIHVGAWAMF